MKMKDVVEKLAEKFGPTGDTQPGPMVERIMKLMPDKDVPEATYRKIVAIGKAMKGAGVPR